MLFIYRKKYYHRKKNAYLDCIFNDGIREIDLGIILDVFIRKIFLGFYGSYCRFYDKDLFILFKILTSVVLYIFCILFTLFVS